jgi:cardiolipin synthase
MSPRLSTAIRKVIQRASFEWIDAVTIALRGSPATATPEIVKKRMPPSTNADLSFLLWEVIDAAGNEVSWEAVSFGLEVAHQTYSQAQIARQIEMLWSGPPPAGHLPARRIDQTLYDLIARAKREILLVTFAAVKVDRLASALLQAANRGVRIRLILEFAEASEGQLSFDALNAFPPALVASVEVYYWPVEKRQRNDAGRPGKLHAKLALIDDAVLMSSANLTDDAFNRNLELGVRLTDASVVSWARGHFEGLVNDSTLRRL